MFNFDLFTINWVTISALATLIVVVLNLLILFVIPWCRSPKFSISYTTGFPFCRYTMAIVPPNKWANAYWIRLKVRNSGKSIAKRCLAKLVKIMDADGLEDERFDPIQLHWVSTDWNYPLPSSLLPPIDLSRNEHEYLDLLVTQLNNNNIYIGGENGIPSPEVVERRQILNRLSPGKYILAITIYGDDVKPKTKYVSLIWNGANMEDFSLELHDNLQKAKSWLMERKLTSEVRQIKYEPQKVSLENYIISQIPTYFILGVTLVYVSSLVVCIPWKYLFEFLAIITLLWTFCLWMIAFSLLKRLKRLGLLIRFIGRISQYIGKRYEQAFYGFASLLVLATGFIMIYPDFITSGVVEPIRFALFGLLFLCLILNSIFVHFVSRQKR